MSDVSLFRFETAISELIDTPSHDDHNPLMTVARFIFADDRPNGNKQAVPFEEFEGLAKSAIGMPVKIKFTGLGAADHIGSSPIGHIVNMITNELEDGSHQLIAEAALWKEEFPEIIDWLKQKLASGEPPGISWELKYKESSKDSEGVEWLRKVVAQAATFVKTPAYGARTALLALASVKNPEKYGDEIAQSLIALAEQLKGAPKEPSARGGSQMTEEEIAKLKADAAAEVAALTAKVTELETALAEKVEEVSTLKEENASLNKAALIETRSQQYINVVGSLPAEASEADKKKEIFATYTEDQWAQVIADLEAVKAEAEASAKPKDKKAAASLTLQIPKPDPKGTVLTQESLRDGLRGLSRQKIVE